MIRKVIENRKQKNIVSPPPDIEFDFAYNLHCRGDLSGAERAYLEIVRRNPKHFEAYHFLGLIAASLGKEAEAIRNISRAVKIHPEHPAALCNLGAILKGAGRYQEAIEKYDQAIRLKPDFDLALNNKADALVNLSRFEDALVCSQAAISIDAQFADGYLNQGVALQGLNRFAEALNSYAKALALNPNHSKAMCNRVATLLRMFRLDEAVVACRAALEAHPGSHEAHFLMGLALCEMQKFEAALSFFDQAISLKPGDAETFAQRGNALRELGRFAEASDSYNQANAIKPNYCDPILDFGVTGSRLNPAAIAALQQPEAPKSQIEGTVASQTITSGHDLDADLPLQAVLTSMPISDSGMEKFLTIERKKLLGLALDARDVRLGAGSGLLFYAALARQCFINEYIFSQDPDEWQDALDLKRRVIDALAVDGPVEEIWIVALAAYLPLYSIAGSKKLLGRRWPEQIAAILLQQIQEPSIELDLRLTLPRLTSVDSEVSLKVKDQYEENPYPRWVKLPKRGKSEPADVVIRGLLPNAEFTPLGNRRKPEILIAGCGTGQQSIETAMLFPDGKILAVDLSVASLSYAKRKSQEAKIRSIEYAQADILQLSALGRVFDIIECVGVLHHLADPMSAWQTLLACLRPGGLMRVALYSKLGRRNIERARELLKRERFGSTPDEMRRARSFLLGIDAMEHLEDVTHAADFFSVSACRDLLFHVQEHQMTLAEIANFLREQRLSFLGFAISKPILRAYHLRFQNDPAAINLDQWASFESEHPEAFIGMYEFWIQKPLS